MKEANELRLCKYLLEKYADIINEREKRTIGEIKSLVDGSDLTIQSFVDGFKDSAYSFDADYKKALEMYLLRCGWYSLLSVQLGMGQC